MSRSLVPLRVGSADRDRFRASVRVAVTDGVKVSEVAAGPHTVWRTRGLIADGDAGCFTLNLHLRGSALLVQDGREAQLSAGDLAVHDTARPYSLAFGENSRTVVLMIPKHLLELPPMAVGRLTAVRLGGAEVGAGLTGAFLERLGGVLDALDGPVRSRVLRSALDLVDTLFSSELERHPIDDRPHGVLLRSVFDYIDHHLSLRDLDPGLIARAHFISTGHLHALFRESGTTVSSWIVQRRLRRCRRDLVDPQLAGVSVAAIAARWGFAQAAHFGRGFKETYGETPGEYRARMLGVRRSGGSSGSAHEAASVDHVSRSGEHPV